MSMQLSDITIMSTIIPNTRKPRKDALYRRDELEVLNKYKEEYRQQTTRELRANVFKTKILVDLFNFWLEKGRAPATEEESIIRMKVSQLINPRSVSQLPVLHSGAGSMGTKQLASVLNYITKQAEYQGYRHKCCMAESEAGGGRKAQRDTRSTGVGPE